MISTIEDVTPAWLTGRLQNSGLLTRGEVCTVALTGVFDQQPQSISYFLRAEYSADAVLPGPNQFFLKLPRPSVAPELRWELGTKEVKLYQAVSGMGAAPPFIPCYDAQLDLADRTYSLLLRDLEETHTQPEWHLQIDDLFISATVDSLARLHAIFWEHELLAGGLTELPNATELAQEIQLLRRVFDSFSAYLGVRLSSAARTAYSIVLENLAVVWSRRSSLQSQTLVHGDSHFWNLLYPRDPAREQTYILDWQTYRAGFGCEDLAYTIVLRYPQRASANEHQLVMRYYRQLVSSGVRGYSWTECWDDYRISAALQLLAPVRWWQGGLAEEFWSPFLDQPVRAFYELRCADLFECN